MNISFSSACAQDIEVLFSFNRELIETYEDLSQINAEAVYSWVRRKLDKCIGEYRRILRNGEHVGYVRFSPVGYEMEVDDFYILPPYRNQGIGTAVLEKLFAETDWPVFLHVFTQNTGAVRLYRRMGFETIETINPTRMILQRNP